MDVLINTFGKVFKALIQVLYETDEESTIDSLKEMSLGADVRVFRSYEFVILITVTVLIGILLGCIFGCFMCCCSCCCCPVYQEELYGSLSSNSVNSLSNKQDAQYTYYG